MFKYWFSLTHVNSSIYKVIRPVLNFLFSFYDKISQVQKSTKKHQKAPKSIKKHQKAPKSIKKHPKAPKGTK